MLAKRAFPATALTLILAMAPALGQHNEASERDAVTSAQAASPPGPPPAHNRLLVGTPGRGQKGGTFIEVRPFGEFTFNADFNGNDGAEIGTTRTGVAVKTEFWLERFFTVTFDAAVEYSEYRFDGFAANTDVPEPLDDALRVNLRPGARMMLSREWLVFAGGMVEFSGEPDSELEDSLNVGGFAGARYQLREDLALRFGISAVQAVEEDLQAFPILGFKWDINDDMVLEAVGAQGGGAVQYTYDWLEPWNLGGRVGWLARDIRLASDAAIPGGVLRDDRLIIEGFVTYAPTKWIDLTGGVGVAAFNEVIIENSNGNELFEDEAGPTPFVSLRGKIRF